MKEEDMSHSEKIKQQLFNDKSFQALYATIKPADKEGFEAILENLLGLANSAVDGFVTKANNTQFTKEELDSVISDRTGRK